MAVARSRFAQMMLPPGAVGASASAVRSVPIIFSEVRWPLRATVGLIDHGSEVSCSRLSVPFGDPLSCAVCRRAVDPSSGHVILSLDDDASSPKAYVDAVVVVCEVGCRAQYVHPGWRLTFQRLDQLDPDRVIQEMMLKYRWASWALDCFAAILGAVVVRARSTSPAAGKDES